MCRIKLMSIRRKELPEITLQTRLTAQFNLDEKSFS